MARKRKGYCLFLLLLLLFFPSAGAVEQPLAEGERIVLLASGGNMALSAERGRIGLLGAAVNAESSADGVIWTLHLLPDGRIQLENGGNYLSLEEDTLGLSLNGELDCWHISETEAGLVTLTNPESGRMLTWYPGPEVFGASQTASAFTAFRLLRLSQEPPEMPTTEVPTEFPSEPPASEIPAESTGEIVTEPSVPPTEEPELPTAPDGEWNFYFGQLHAHTVDSDGVGTVAEAYAQAKMAGLDFFAVTDHSDSFDHDKEGLLTDGSISENWTTGKAAAEAATDGNFVAIYGFEMSWNQGQGHITTFNTPGFLSRDRDGYRTYKDGMEAYFEDLSEVPESVSQFNHPGTIYGDFKAFSGYDPKVDPVICLIEVGSGAKSEYQTAYDAYVQALDAGWHLAPTNNHNNHEGQFGTADTGRTVILAENLTEQSLYEAMKACRVYATEDSNLRISYTLNGSPMGSQLRASQVGACAELEVSLFDPGGEALGAVDVIGPAGQVAASAEAAETLHFSLPIADYYFIRITQPDGDIAVTAPVWIRQTDNIGISAFHTATDLTWAGEEQTILLTLFNREAEALTVKSVTLKEGDSVIGTVGESVLEAYTEGTFTFFHTFKTDGVKSLRVATLVEFAREEMLLQQELEIPVLPVIVTSDVLIDGTHGQSADFGEFIALAASKNVSVRVESETVTESQLAACRLLVIPVPEEALEPEFLEQIGRYVNSGGHLLLLGKPGGSEEGNRLLETLGSSLGLHADTLRDEVSNDGDPTHLYTADLAPADWTAGILEGQIFAHIGGCSLTGGTWLVKSSAGHVLLAAEGRILVSGSNFLADDLLKKSENPWALPFANRVIAENLLGITRTLPTIGPIGDVRTGNMGSIYLVEGLVTAGTHNVNTDFPGSIYIQDASGALEARGYSEHGLELGRRVRILGSLADDGGRPVLEILHIEIFEKETPILPQPADGLDYGLSGDHLLLAEGTVTRVITEESVKSFVLRDASDREITVWVEDYIFSGSMGYNQLDRIVKPGNRVSAVGFCHLREGQTVLRIRDCDEVLLLWEPPEPTTEPATEAPTEPVTEPATEAPTEPATEPATEAPTEPATEVPTEPTTEPGEEPTTEPATVPTTEPTAPPETTVPPTTEIPTTGIPTTEPEPPADPDNPPTGDRVSPQRLLLTMALCCVLCGVTIKKGRP